MAKGSRGRTSSGTTSSSTTTHTPSSNHTSSGQQTAKPDKNSVGSGVGSGMNGKKAAAGAAAVTGAAYALDAGAVGDMAKWFGHALGDLGGDFFGGAMDGAGLGGTMYTVLFVAGGVVILYVVMR